MTSFGPPHERISLQERLVGAQAVVLGRLGGLVEEWPDPCGGGQDRFGVLDVAVVTTLRGEVPGQIQVRIAGKQTEEDMEWPMPVDEGEEVLLLLSPDEEGDSPRYALQYGSGFRVRDGVLEVPEDLPLGDYATEPGALPLEIVERALHDLEAVEERRWRHFEAGEGRGWADREYPAVEEIGDPLEDEVPRRDPGGRDGAPTMPTPRASRGKREGKAGKDPYSPGD